MDIGIRGRRFLVTGGSAGIGYAVAESVVAEGASVVINGRDPERLASAAHRLGATASGLAGDLGDPLLLSAITEEIVEHGAFDGALLSVGGPPVGGWADADDAAWRREFETGFLGIARLIRELAPTMRSGGVIVVVLSTSAKVPINHLAISSMLRPGLAALVKMAADDLGPRDVRVLGLVPGRIATNRTIQVDAGRPGAREASEATIPLRRLGRPEEIGRIGAILLSPIASYMTGSLVAVDGGMMRSQ